MSDIGITADYNNFANAINSTYGTPSVAPIKEISQDDNEQKQQIKNDDIEDTATISDEAKALYEADKAQKPTALNKSEQKEDTEKNVLISDEQKTKDTEDTKQTEKTTAKNDAEFSQAEKEQIADLKSRDAEVKAHEQAHRAAAAGINASAANYTYEVGPDGNRYAVAGEVSISFREGSSPEQNIQNAKAMKAAALAPAQPSGQDLSVARHADQLVAQYTKELSQIEDDEVATDNNQTTDNSDIKNDKQTTSNQSTIGENEQNQPVNMLNNDDRQAHALDLSKEEIKTSQINNININDMTSRQNHPILMP